MVKDTKIKNRGRSGAHLSLSEQTESKVELETDRADEAHSRRSEVRKPMDNNLKLQYPIRAGYYGHWIRDDNIKNAEEAWYEYVVVNGKKVTRRDEFNTLYLMELPNDLREKDLQAKKDEVRRRSRGLQALKGDEYIPNGNKLPLQKDGDFDPFE